MFGCLERFLSCFWYFEFMPEQMTAGHPSAHRPGRGILLHAARQRHGCAHTRANAPPSFACGVVPRHVRHAAIALRYRSNCKSIPIQMWSIHVTHGEPRVPSGASILQFRSHFRAPRGANQRKRDLLRSGSPSWKKGRDRPAKCSEFEPVLNHRQQCGSAA